MILALKKLKDTYREKFDQLRITRSEVEYCSKTTDQCRQKLMAEFEQWYENIYGAQIVEGDGGKGGIEDAMDVGEIFDRLQMERMSKEDPDSLPYYNAKKNTERRNQKAVKKLNMAPLPRVIPPLPIATKIK